MASPETCPHCGADVPRKAKACPECGSDESTGWSDRAYAERLDLPDEEFDYDEFVQREFGKQRQPRLHWFWWTVAVLLLVMFGWFLLKR